MSFTSQGGVPDFHQIVSEFAAGTDVKSLEDVPGQLPVQGRGGASGVLSWGWGEIAPARMRLAMTSITRSCEFYVKHAKPCLTSDNTDTTGFHRRSSTGLGA